MLIQLPKAISHSIEHNPHAAYYETVAQYLADWNGDEITPEDMIECVRTGELWTLQWYPVTPIGFCRVAGPTLERVLQRASAP